MTLSKKQIAIGVVAYSGLMFGLGRYTLPDKVKESTERNKTVVEDKTKTDNKTVEKDVNKRIKRTKVEKINKDGSKTITTRTVEDTVDKSKTDSAKNEKTSSKTEEQSKESKETERGSSKVTISGLVGVNLSAGLGAIVPVYGISATKPFLGPLTGGVFGMSNGTAGISLGLTF